MPDHSAPAISDAVAQKATGKGWAAWFALLDAAGAAKLDHTAIATLLHDGHGWWCQMVAVEHERARGLRVKHQSASGFQMCRSKTIGAPAAAAFEVWHDPARREAWRGPVSQPLLIRKTTPPTTLRITWPDRSHLEVRITAKGDARCQVAADHTKLPDAASVHHFKASWADALERLRATIEV